MNDQIAKRIKSYCEQTGKSYNDIVIDIRNRNLGDISTATLSNMANGKWEKISHAMWNKVATYLGLNLGWQIVKTKVYEEITTACNEAQNYAQIKLIVGKTGIGKTTAYERYQASSKAVFLITCAAEMNKKEFITSIASAVGITNTGTKFETIRSITEKLINIDKPLIILDEVGKLPTNYLTIVQTIYEFSGKNVGFILSGVNYLYDNLLKAAAKHKQGMPELEGRISEYIPFEENPSYKEKASVAIANGINETEVRDFLKQEGINSLRDLYFAIQHYKNQTVAGPKSDN